MYNNLLLFQELGIFEETMGYLAMLVAFVLGVWILIFSKAEIWQVGQEAVPKNFKGIIVVCLAASIVFIWSKITPLNLEAFLQWLIIWAIIAIISFFIYFGFKRVFSFKEYIFDENNDKVKIPIIGGLWLLNSAKLKMQQEGINSPQQLLDKGVDKSNIWSRGSIEVTRQLLMLTFLGIIFCSVTSLTIGGFYLQTNISDKAPIEIIRAKKEADKKTQKQSKNNTTNNGKSQ